MNPLASGVPAQDTAQSTTRYRAADFTRGREVLARVSLEDAPVAATVWCVEGDAGIGWLIVRVTGRPALDTYGTGEYVHIPGDRCAPDPEPDRADPGWDLWAERHGRD